MPSTHSLKHILTARCSVCGIASENEYCSFECQGFKQKSGYLRSFLDLFWGIKTVACSRPLLKLAFLPLVLTLILLAVLLFFGLEWFQAYLNHWLAQSISQSFWGQSLKALFAMFSWFSAAVLLIVLFLPISALITMPFMDPVSAQVEAKLLKASPAMALNIPYILKELFWLSMLKIALMIPALLALFIPVIGPFIFTFLTALTISMDFLDLIWMRKNYSFQEKKHFLGLNLSRWLFYNLPLMLMLWIPVLQILIIPGAAAGAVRFYLHAPKRPG